MLLAGRLILAICALGLGVLGWATSDFIGHWQPAPAGLPAHRELAWLSAAVLLACGAGVAWPKAMRMAALALAAWLALSIVALNGPLVVAAPANVGLWVYAGEMLAIACGALTLWAWPERGKWATAARIGYGVALIAFGVSHFVYLKIVASGVPAYFPMRLELAELTGAAHLAAGAALITNVAPRLAATLEAAMVSLIALLINVPRVMAHSDSKGAWMVLLAEGAMIGAAWIIAATVEARRRAP